MKIWSTPPQRFRQRIDYVGPARVVVGGPLNAEPTITLMGSFPEDETGRHYRVHLTEDEVEEMHAALARWKMRHAS